MADDEIIEGEVVGQELVPSHGAPVTLFRTDDPVEIVERATKIADALTDVLMRKNLTKRIGNKDYVQVEGWALCGSMLGVFPVVEWTRPVEGGWEARVEARTKDGHVVGAAEAECLRTENRWKNADDYSIRSMAQTRAVSKALRAPLGFIVALAGYEATPEEEMVRPETQQEKPFDPETDLMPGVKPSDAAKALVSIDPNVEWAEVLDQIDSNWRSLSDPGRTNFFRRLANAATRMSDEVPAGQMPPITDEQIVTALAWAFSGAKVEVVRKAPAPISAEDAAKADLVADDVEFGPVGYENPSDG